MNHFTSIGGLSDALVGALCLWRITHLLNIEEGPFALAAQLRARVGESFVGAALDCFYCLSLWLAAPLAALIGTDWPSRLLLWPALSGAACLLEQATTSTPLPAVIYENKQE